ncbi:hypothetical protein, variant [Plasmodium yoelii 17X]|uniref:Fam-c protein n=2 Tax=Plasmodium yoelii TaxID=5861 RepID=A0A4V0KQ75_PLAYE|nr:fam-c protein [Plasmodium yoelii]ETB56401.1 hypothetical protein, variant [Plasmodium yoelii 17X]VTZ80390.1 fam-c protein [Plasmodium yoelii]|eukprot:XP_022813454.1 fam-c protein [Plasmodium yoelii]
MNKRVYSLVCIALYAFLAGSIHCFDPKVSVAGYTSDIDTKKINGNNEADDIEYKHETQLKNNNPKDGAYDEDDKDNKEFNCFNIFKRDKKKKKKPIINDVPVTLPYNKIVLTYSNNESLPTVTMRMGQIQRRFIPKDQKHLEDVLKLQKIFEELYSNNDESLSKAPLKVSKELQDMFGKIPKFYSYYYLLKEKLEKKN